MKKLIIYNHGRDSEPWGTKTLAFSDVAKRRGYDMESPDYRGQENPDKRVKMLLSLDFTGYQHIVLIGSSMGAYVATLAAASIKPQGLFLLAPAFYLPGYQQTEFNPPAKITCIFHGWQDEIVPPEHAWKFCQRYHIRLQMLDADHRLISELPYLVDEFDRFLAALI